MFVSLFPAQVAKVEGRAAPDGAPEVALYRAGEMVSVGRRPSCCRLRGLYQTRIAGDRASTPVPFAPAATAAGESDPWMALGRQRRDLHAPGSCAGVGERRDLFITFRDGDGWTPPVALSEINDSAGPDYAVSIAASPERIYWKRRAGLEDAGATDLRGALARQRYDATLGRPYHPDDEGEAFGIAADSIREDFPNFGIGRGRGGQLGRRWRRRRTNDKSSEKH